MYALSVSKRAAKQHQQAEINHRSQSHGESHDHSSQYKLTMFTSAAGPVTSSIPTPTIKFGS